MPKEKAPAESTKLNVKSNRNNKNSEFQSSKNLTLY